jgi:hypothetical protein
MKVYWPYLPLIAIAVFGSLMLVMDINRRNQAVLSYATEIGSSSLLQATNSQRKAHNRPALTIDSKLSSAAQSKADDMAKRNYWSHNTPDGKEPWVFLQQSGYSYQKAGENMAYGFATSKDTIKGWMNSPGHRANLLDESYQQVGFGFANVANYQDSGPATIVVAEYGTPLGTDNTSPASVNSARTVLTNQATAVNRLQNITHGKAPSWSILLVGLIGGSALTYLLVKHALGLRKLVLKGEAFFLHHPLIDACLLAMVFLSLFLSHTVGFVR